MADIYYTTPSNKIFNEIKEKSIEIWRTYNDTYGYATEKIDKIKDLTNISDNAMTMVAMFDTSNQVTLALRLSCETRKAIADRITAGGTPREFNFFYSKDD